MTTVLLSLMLLVLQVRPPLSLASASLPVLVW
eukprot:CAMPEP_0179163148 /NCGR_PEP_ID=MMETSP0796-20121207/79973_1 /TAXON_ID=73915 /ORGANISM="Pyrodinium bahamense, Strain pbaha01" /LENGTH=31 /DNA_ID= /DNA_START= /DNA_END= /DNA_ORIENTATION=